MSTNTAAVSDVFTTTLETRVLWVGPEREALETYKKRDTTRGALKLFRNFRFTLLTVCSIVVVLFKAVGNVPIMKQNIYRITAGNRFQAVIVFLKRELGLKVTDPLVCESV